MSVPDAMYCWGERSPPPLSNTLALKTARASGVKASTEKAGESSKDGHSFTPENCVWGLPCISALLGTPSLASSSGCPRRQRLLTWESTRRTGGSLIPAWSPKQNGSSRATCPGRGTYTSRSSSWQAELGVGHLQPECVTAEKLLVGLP